MAKELKSTKIIRGFAKEFPGEPTLTLAKRIYAKHKAVFNNVEHVRSQLRLIRGNSGDVSRKEKADKELYRPSGHQSDRPQMPASKSKTWEPYDMPGKNVLVLSDLHVPYHDKQAIEKAVEFSQKEHNINSVLLNGDIADMHSKSKWERAPDENDLRGELQAVREFLVWLSHQFPRRKIVYKWGNHEEWSDKYYWRKAPELWGVPNMRLDALLSVSEDLEPIKEIKRIEWVKDKRPINIGKLTVFHGHELPRGLTNAVNPARGAFLRMTDTVLIGHHHRSSSHPHYTWDKKPINCWSTGCLCCMHPEYAPINGWNHGFAVVERGNGDTFNVYNYKMLPRTYDIVTA